MATCLIVDDSRTVRKLVRHIVVRLGFVVEEAENGRLALDSCERALPDVVLLDWNMPEMDGLAFLQAMRRLPGGERPVVIFCTTVNELPRIAEALEAGADEYIMKPFDEDIVRDKLVQAGVI
jgi:two-component system, chemotaxis family, chemotaxis protein CheY